MYVKAINITFPLGTYSYNGNSYHVTAQHIEKSKDFYPNVFEKIVSYGNIVKPDSGVTAIMLKGLARTLGIK